MKKMINNPRNLNIILLCGCISFISSCDSLDDLLVVSNPSELQESTIDDPALTPTLITSIEGAMVDAYDYRIIWMGSMFTDQQITGVNWEQTARLNQRIVNYDESTSSGMFAELHDLTVMADMVVEKLKAGLIPNASSDARTAYAQAYAGYGYIFLADILCETNLKVQGTVYQPIEIYEMAKDRLKDALTIASSAGDDDIQNLARVGLARANLNLGNYSEVISNAGAVSPDFKWWVQYAGEDNPDAPGNNMWTSISGQNHRIGVHSTFLAGGPDNWLETDLEPFLTDPRVQHWPYWRQGHNALSPLYTPYQGLRYSGYNGETIADGGQPAEYERTDDILLADFLSATHDYWEAIDEQGSDQAGVLAFVNERRLVGNQEAVDLSGTDLTMELRMQRGKDLFLGGFRLGDLRRWLRGGTDMFPSGAHPIAEWGEYGDATCFPIPLPEYDGNTNLSKPG